MDSSSLNLSSNEQEKNSETEVLEHKFKEDALGFLAEG